METKVCCTCKQEKTTENFSRNRRSKDGYKEYCKQCAKEKTKRYREKFADEINARNKLWYEKSKREKDKRTQKELDRGYRVCTSCHIKKDIQEFYKRGNGGFYGECKKCHNDKARMYVEENREKVLKRKRIYNLRTREHRLKYLKQYSKLNSEKNVLRAKKWKENNPEKYKEIQTVAFHRRSAKMKNVKSDFTREQWRFCKDYFRNENGFIECAYCNKEMKKATQDHFIPVHKDGAYTAGNILPVCPNCNSRKSASDFFEWYPETEFYSTKNIDKINSYFNLIKAKQANTVPSL